MPLKGSVGEDSSYLNFFRLSKDFRRYLKKVDSYATLALMKVQAIDWFKLAVINI